MRPLLISGAVLLLLTACCAHGQEQQLESKDVLACMKSCPRKVNLACAVGLVTLPNECFGHCARLLNLQPGPCKQQHLSANASPEELEALRLRQLVLQAWNQALSVNPVNPVRRDLEAETGSGEVSETEQGSGEAGSGSGSGSDSGSGSGSGSGSDDENEENEIYQTFRVISARLNLNDGELQIILTQPTMQDGLRWEHITLFDSQDPASFSLRLHPATIEARAVTGRFSVSHRLTKDELYELLRRKVQTLFVAVEPEFAQDATGANIEPIEPASALPCVMIKDFTAPRLLATKVDLVASTVFLQFSEPVDIMTIAPSRIGFTAVRDDAAPQVFLTGSMHVMTVNDPTHTSLTIFLTDADRESLSTFTASIFVLAEAKAVADIYGNFLAAIAARNALSSEILAEEASGGDAGDGSSAGDGDSSSSSSGSGGLSVPVLIGAVAGITVLVAIAALVVVRRARANRPLLLKSVTLAESLEWDDDINSSQAKPDSSLQMVVTEEERKQAEPQFEWDDRLSFDGDLSSLEMTQEMTFDDIFDDKLAQATRENEA